MGERQTAIRPKRASRVLRASRANAARRRGLTDRSAHENQSTSPAVLPALSPDGSPERPRREGRRQSRTKSQSEEEALSYSAESGTASASSDSHHAARACSSTKLMLPTRNSRSGPGKREQAHVQKKVTQVHTRADAMQKRREETYLLIDLEVPRYSKNHLASRRKPKWSPKWSPKWAPARGSQEALICGLSKGSRRSMHLPALSTVDEGSPNEESSTRVDARDMGHGNARERRIETDELGHGDEHDAAESQDELRTAGQPKPAAEAAGRVPLIRATANPSKEARSASLTARWKLPGGEWSGCCGARPRRRGLPYAALLASPPAVRRTPQSRKWSGFCGARPQRKALPDAKPLSELVPQENVPSDFDTVVCWPVQAIVDCVKKMISEVCAPVQHVA